MHSATFDGFWECVCGEVEREIHKNVSEDLLPKIWSSVAVCDGIYVEKQIEDHVRDFVWESVFVEVDGKIRSDITFNRNFYEQC